MFDDTKKPFTDLMIRVMPSRPGVYALWDHQGVIYIGTAENNGGLRGALDKLWRGEHEPAVRGVSDFQIQVCTSPGRIRDELLDRYRRLHGSYPRFNTTIGDTRDSEEAHSG